MLRRLYNLVSVLVNGPPVYEPVAVPDATAILSMPSGDFQVDMLNTIIIDLVQGGFVSTVRDDTGQLRFSVTELGEMRIKERQGGVYGDGEKPLPSGVAVGRGVRGC